jgi:hypothetical protein
MANKIKIAKMMIAMKNRTLAIPAVAAERPEKPKKPATMEITKKISAHFNTYSSLSLAVPQPSASGSGLGLAGHF